MTSCCSCMFIYRYKMFKTPFFFNWMSTPQMVKFIFKKILRLQYSYPLHVLPCSHFIYQYTHTHTSFFDLFLWAAIDKYAITD